LAETKTAAKSADMQQWIKTNKARALELCSMALETANDLFDSGDLRPYIQVLSRLHCFNFYNILLILRQYPNATCLTTFKEWQSRMENPNQQVLKREYIGKGIETIAPFTNLQPSGTRSLTWYSVKQFDISQTNVTSFLPPKSIYEPGQKHLVYLNSALRGVISLEFHCNVSIDTTDREIYNAGIPGVREGTEILCRANLSQSERLTWLLQNLIDLSRPEVVVGAQYKHLFHALAANCLLQIWGIQDRGLLYLHQDADLVRSVPADLRPVFLDLLQRSVRRFEEAVHCEYVGRLQHRTEVPDMDPKSIQSYV